MSTAGNAESAARFAEGARSPAPPLHVRASLSCAALLLAASALGACRSEAGARVTMEKHGVAFALCKEVTEQLRMKPGAHRCSLVSSMGLDASLKESALDAATVDRMRSEWLARTGYQPFYIPAELRAPENR